MYSLAATINTKSSPNLCWGGVSFMVVMVHMVSTDIHIQHSYSCGQGTYLNVGKAKRTIIHHTLLWTRLWPRIDLYQDGHPVIEGFQPGLDPLSLVGHSQTKSSIDQTPILPHYKKTLTLEEVFWDPLGQICA